MPPSPRFWTMGLLLAAGRVHTNATVLNPGAMSRVRLCPEAVVICRTQDQAKAPIKEIALLHASGESTWTTEPGMLNALRKKAAEMGANGVILSGVKNPSAGAEVAGAFLGTGANQRGEALAIYVHADSLGLLKVCRDFKRK